MNTITIGRLIANELMNNPAAAAVAPTITHSPGPYRRTTPVHNIPQNVTKNKYLNETSYYSYARPAHPGPNRTRVCGPCIAAIAGDKVRFGPIR